MSEHFPERKSSGRKVKVELDLPNYARKADLKNETVVDTSKFAKNVGLANLESNVDKLDLDKLKNVPSGWSSLKSNLDIWDVDKLVTVLVDLGKLSDIVKNDVVKKTITNLTTTTTLNAKINEV